MDKPTKEVINQVLSLYWEWATKKCMLDSQVNEISWQDYVLNNWK